MSESVYLRVSDHASLRVAAVVDENGVPPVGGRVRVGASGGFAVILLRAAGRKVHGYGGVPSVVTDRLWTVRGRGLVRVPGPSWWGTTVAAVCACVSLLY